MDPHSEDSIVDEELEPADGSFLDVSLTEVVSTTLSCETCGATFKRKDNLNRHKKKHLAETQYHCSYCNTYYKTDELLQQHKSTKHEVAHLCPTCGKQFKTKKGLKWHTSVAHNDGTPTKSKVHICPFTGCGIKFVSRTKFVDHMNIHTRSKPYICRGCGKAFADRYKKTQHENICTGRKSISCNHCSLPFN